MSLKLSNEPGFMVLGESPYMKPWGAWAQHVSKTLVRWGGKLYRPEHQHLRSVLTICALHCRRSSCQRSS